MTGLLSRLARRSSAPPEPAVPDPGAAGEPTADSAPAPGATAPDVATLGRGAATGAPPAGVDPADAASRPAGARERGRLRRRLRYLERARELLLRDLGGLVYDIHRFGAGARHDRLVAAKVEHLATVDRELGALEAALGVGGGVRELRVAGIGGTCGRCGALHGSDASFCSSCGAPVADGARRSAVGVRPAAEGSVHAGGDHARGDHPDADVDGTLGDGRAGEPLASRPRP
jgi:hypothetical protein